jgi:3-methyl-2-oxobutanoate hydroxymethyltransferase
MTRITAASLKDRKKNGGASPNKIAVLTAYDFPSAKIIDESEVDIILVGDSCGMVVMGYPDTLGVTLDDMVHQTRMVSRAVQHALVIADMPFLSYQVSPEEALRNAGRLVVEGGAHGVKLEGPVDKFGDAIAAILRAGIPVMGHIGLTPQSVNQIGGYKVQGRSPECRIRLCDEAQGLEQIGCFSMVLECIPADLAAEITAQVSIPTIGIGAGASCDGQVLVLHDILGWGTARFSKTFGDVKGLMAQACRAYVEEVRSGAFPDADHAFK